MKKEVSFRRVGQRHRWCIRTSVWRYMRQGLPITGDKG